MSINLNHVRQLFSQPKKLAAADFIYREIAARMAERLQLVRLDPKHILDAGCGRGADLTVLRTHYASAHITGLDSSQKLLEQAFALQATAPKSLFQKLFNKKAALNSNWINGDFVRVPLQDQAVELIWSNLALHWHSEPARVFKEWHRLLNVDGLLMFSCFGPDTFKEIRHAFEQVDQHPHTLSFIDMHDFGDMLVHAGFATPVMDMEVITLTYESVSQLLSEVRSLGGNPLQERRTSLMGKTAWQQMCQRLEQTRKDGRIPLTLEIIYGHAFKPVAKSNQPGVSVIKFDKLKKT